MRLGFFSGWPEAEHWQPKWREISEFHKENQTGGFSRRFSEDSIWSFKVLLEDTQEFLISGWKYCNYVVLKIGSGKQIVPAGTLSKPWRELSFSWGEYGCKVMSNKFSKHFSRFAICPFLGWVQTSPIRVKMMVLHITSPVFVMLKGGHIANPVTGYCRASRTMRCCAPSEILEELTLESSRQMKIPETGIERSSTSSNSAYFTMYHLSLKLWPIFSPIYCWWLYKCGTLTWWWCLLPNLKHGTCQGSSSPASANDRDSGSAKHCGTREGLRIYWVWLECLVCWSWRLKRHPWDVHNTYPSFHNHGSGKST